MKTLNIFFLLIFSIVCQLLFSQDQREIDSLKTLLQQELDSEKRIKLLEELHSSLIYRAPKQALNFAKDGLKLSLETADRNAQLNAYYNIGVGFMTLGNIDSAKYYHLKGEALARALEQKLQLAYSISAIANIKALEGDFDESIATYEKANEIFKEKDSLFDLGIGIGNVASIYMAKGSNKIAQAKSMEALKVLDNFQRDPYRKADILRRIGHIQYNIKDFQESIKYFNQALKVYLETDDNVYASETYVDIGTSLAEMGEYKAAISQFEKCIALTEKYDLKGTQAIAYTNLGNALRKIKDYNTSFLYLKKSLDYQLEHGFVNNKIEVLKSMSELYFDQNQTSKSIEYINKAIIIADSVKSIDYLMNTYLLRSQIFEKQERNMLALSDRKKHEVFKDSIFNIKKVQQIDELTTIYETEKKEAALALQEEEINTLNEKAKVDKLTKGLYAGGMASALALSGLLVFGFRQRIKKNKIAREKQEEIYRQEIAHKKKELASQTLHLVQKNTFIQELKENLENLKNSPEKFKVEFRRIVMLLKKQNASDKDWEVFKSYFSEVHNDFDQKLKTLYPDISEKEIRLTAFLRMNLTTKEIAATLNVLPDSILKSKYRLKKKLELDKDIDLTSFLNTL
ncbi:tetratricopeptide repeat protein [Flagellimonas sp. S3867]|uniref:tetratricopeptide repeat protein n=1 Tax=Flagellimonas sp. S3867 TaxID=2768063 RepID=UPI00168325C2|nr:tetratricopeptide repeat protein [Flagellimonas sp. S3867]